jgi:hypothetical protein
MAYALLCNYLLVDKVEFEVSEECADTVEVQRALEVIETVEKCNYEEFSRCFVNSDYVLACALVPFVM